MDSACNDILDCGIYYEYNCEDYNCEWNGNNCIADNNIDELPEYFVFEADQVFSMYIQCNGNINNCEIITGEWGINAEDNLCIYTPGDSGFSWNCLDFHEINSNNSRFHMPKGGNNGCFEFFFNRYCTMNNGDSCLCEDMNGCGICDGGYEEAPSILTIDPPSIFDQAHFTIDDTLYYLSLNPGKMEIEFSRNLSDGSLEGVSISSLINSGFNESYWHLGMANDRTIQVFFDKIPSSDILEITIDWNNISFDNCEYTKNEKTIIRINTQTLGDFNKDNDLDGEDIHSLLGYWVNNITNEDGRNIDLAPIDGSPPHFIPLTDGTDGTWNLDDLMVFIRNWRWFQKNSVSEREKSTNTATFGPQVELEIKNNQLIMQFPAFDNSMARIWFQLSLPGSEIDFTVADFGNLFDISLKSNKGDNVHVWNLAKLGSIDLQNLVLGIFDTQNKETQELEFQYQVISRNGLLSSGTLMVEYTPLPDNYELSQAFPNPFNPSATVHYALPADVHIMLSVFDIQGRLVSYLDRGFKPAGYYEAIWDGSNSVSGLYFIHMQVYDSGNTLQFNKIQKIMLVK